SMAGSWASIRASSSSARTPTTVTPRHLRLVAQVDERAVGVRGNAARERELRVAMVGMSIDESCGVRDYAPVLLPALGKEGVDCSLHWLDRKAIALAGARAETRAGIAAIAAE